MFEEIEKDVIYKGCTRPALLFGVPIIPCIFVGGGSALLLTLLFNPAWAIVSIVLVLIMRAITKQDDQQFRLLFVYILTRLGMKNKKYWGVDTIQASNYKRGKM